MRLSAACWAAWMMGISVAALSFSAQPPTAPANTPAMNESKGMPPRAAPSDYPAHFQVGSVTIAADFLGHSVPRPEGPLSTEDFVVVETGFFGPPNDRVKLSVEDFSLRINGKKTPLSSQPYGFVVSSLKDPQWEPPEKAAEKSKTGISTGGQGADSNQPPPPVHVPIELQRAMAQHLQKEALPQGDRPLPVAGLIFFQYRGRTDHIRSMELTYAGPVGKGSVPLQP